MLTVTLATLVILLGVSGAIVLRSFTIRRRTQRLVEEAIRNGTYVPPEARVPAHLLEKPKLHDTHIGHGALSEKWADYRVRLISSVLLRCAVLRRSASSLFLRCS